MTAGGRPGPPPREIRPGPRVDVVGEDPAGRPVVRATLGHGDDPELIAADAGWRLGHGIAVDSDTTDGHVLVARFRVNPLQGSVPDGRRGPRRPQGLRARPGERPVVYQRVAAYAVVTSPRGVLLTEYSDQTAAPGSWGLPGGGLEPAEQPEATVLREVWEESGQDVEVGRFLGVRTRHVVGRAPDGRLEDYHAVRLVFAATCDRPTDPVVHDVGGTTASAAWVPRDALAAVRLTSEWRHVLHSGLGDRPLGGTSDEG